MAVKMKKCPHCAKEILVGATKCAHCGKTFAAAEGAAVSKKTSTKKKAAAESDLSTGEMARRLLGGFIAGVAAVALLIGIALWFTVSPAMRTPTFVGVLVVSAFAVALGVAIIPAKLRRETTAGLLGVLVLLVVIVGGAVWYYSNPSTRRSDTAAAGIAEAECRANLQCWGDRHAVASEVACQNEIPKLAQYSHRWTDGFLESKFPRFRWKDASAGTLTYVGDKIELQNGFGAWQPHTYECDYDPSSQRVLDVRATPGRMP